MQGCSDPPPPPGRFRYRLALALFVGVFLALPAVEFFRVLVGSNTHVLLDGRIYRTSQPTAADLGELIQKHGIRTVINLRGCNALMPWYQDEMQVTSQFDICYEDLFFSAGRLPATSELRQLIELFDCAQYPVLIHCWRGADRTGLAAAVAVLLQPESTLAQAWYQMSPRHGHVALGRPANLDLFLTSYEDWLESKQLEHDSRHFRHWAAHEYRGRHGRCEFEECVITPPSPGRNCPFTIQVRAHNGSRYSWEFKSTRSGGIHLGIRILNELGEECISERSGLRTVRVNPGEKIDLVAPLCAPAEPGKYRLIIDLVDEHMGWFFQLGSEPLERELIVRE